MRLYRLEITCYRNLREFALDFDRDTATTALLGHNGTGKSNVIEALVEIFRELELGTAPSFAYRLVYVCRNRLVRIDADPTRRTRRLRVSIDGQPLTHKDYQTHIDDYLPNYVIAYYSGWSIRLEQHFDRPTRRHYDRVLKSPGKAMPLRRLFFCRKEYSQLVLLPFFLSQSAGSRELLEKYLGIAGFESALFVLKAPWWRGSRAPSQVQLDQGDPRFWYARGAFRDFLNRLWDRALAPIRSPETIERDVRRQGEATERVYLFIKNETELSSLKEHGESSKDLFGYLESLFLCDLIDEVRVRVSRTDGTRISFRELSEGEQQLLTVLGLLMFTQDDEALYLLDEPDTHLNPLWAYDLPHLLHNVIRPNKGHVVIASHDPVMIAGLHKEQVRVLRRGPAGVAATEPEWDPIGIGVEGLLKSELYGLRSTLAPEVLAKLDRHYALLGEARRTQDEQDELTGLATELNELGVTRTHPNPYFEHFATAMAQRRSGVLRRDLSKKDVDEQAQLAADILEELLADERSAQLDTPE